MQLQDNGGNSDSSMRDYAKQASNQTGWDAGLIYAQWVLETGNFTSHVFVVDHNLAGIKYASARNNPNSSPGSSANDGGVYAHFSDLSAGVQGYVNFIKANSRYANVKSGKTLAEQAQLLKNDGWATDPDYVQKVLAIAGGNHDVSVTQIGDAGNPTSDPSMETTTIGTKAKEIIKSPLLWVVLLAGLLFKS